MSERTVQVVTSIAVREGTCRYCGKRILFAMRASTPRHPAGWVPFDPPRPWPISHTENHETKVTVETWLASALHFVTCTRKPERTFRGGRRGGGKRAHL